MWDLRRQQLNQQISWLNIIFCSSCAHIYRSVYGSSQNQLFSSVARHLKVFKLAALEHVLPRSNNTNVNSFWWSAVGHDLWIYLMLPLHFLCEHDDAGQHCEESDIETLLLNPAQDQSWWEEILNLSSQLVTSQHSSSVLSLSVSLISLSCKPCCFMFQTWNQMKLVPLFVLSQNCYLKLTFK